MNQSKPTLLFIDPCCPRPYDPQTLDGKGIGGTEQTMVCLAEGLAKTDKFNVVVEQHNRLPGQITTVNATYAPTGFATTAKWAVVLRDPRPMNQARARFPNCKLYLYSHDLADRNLGLCYQEGYFTKPKCLANICVSQWHRNQTVDTLKAYGYEGEFRTKYIYNPLSEDVIRTGEPYDCNKLVWLASPHKGLSRAYEIFKYLVKLNPDFRLYVTNPGYMEDSYTNDASIKDRTVVLGTLPHREAIRHLRTSLLLFYPNSVFPETFGKIMAEANAIGTPVLTGSLGASREVLDRHPEQVMDIKDTEAVIKRVMKWHSGQRPIVRGKPEFKLSYVIKEWEKLLNDVR